MIQRINYKKGILTLLSLYFTLSVIADNGHSLWLRCKPNENTALVKVMAYKSAIINTALTELQQFWHGGRVTLIIASDAPARDGYCIEKNSDETWTVSSQTDCGLLYGAYSLLRMQSLSNLKPIISQPKYDIRILNHWDDLDGTVGRGYSGGSIFWIPNGKPDYNIIREYARANASIGINASCINSLNAKAEMLGKKKLAETKAIADVLRPYGIRVYIAVNFASPLMLKELKTADPLDKNVIEWWNSKVREIYKLIPDFGGFVVKANSEGEPGPNDYGRSHLDGANMLANALRPFGGLVMWRAFVYTDTGEDRVSQAYNEFMPFDGKFCDNVIIQIKNGPLDFQPREPVSPLFFGMKKTRMMPEFQVTQEYTGESIHTCFLASMWSEFFNTLKKIPDTKSLVFNEIGDKKSAISAVANVGNDINWCGSDMAQSNWYAFGRLAWDPDLSPRQIAKEWLEQTYTQNPAFVNPMTDILCQSRDVVVHYMMPIGLHHIFAADHHYGPEPWCNPRGWREDWKPVYFHKADSVGVGFNRSTTGSKNVLQYPQPLCYIYDNIETCPEQLLLWFHHVPWTHKMHNGETLWAALCHTYDLGVRETEAFDSIWRQMKPYVDSERWNAQVKNFDRQAKDAWWWRDACLLYFQTFSKMKFPLDCPSPRHNLTDLKHFRLDMNNSTRADITKLP